jgi:ribose-phosphate pyrophosphokinase
MLIDLDTPGDNLKITRFSDSQPHVNIPALSDPALRDEPIDVRCSIHSPEKLLLLLQVANAIERHGRLKGTLSIPYLMAARYDRVMVPGDSLDIEVVANLINLAEFRQVVTFDAHSDVSTALIKRSRNVTNEVVVRACTGFEDVVLILPDAGAAKKAAKYRQWNPAISETVVQCNKVRNLSNGRITLVVPDPEVCRGRNCLIVDDLCDGGATFVQIASQIQPAHLTLAVSHGIFSKGLAPFVGRFHRIITTTSFPSTTDLKAAPPGIETVVIPHPL